MGQNFGSWFPQKQFDWQLHNLNCSSTPIPSGQQNSIPTIMNPGTNMFLTNGTLPVNAYPLQPHSQVVQPNEPHGWFHCLAHLQQAFMPASNSVLKEQLPACPFGNQVETIKPKVGFGCAQKRFLVFDQSEDQTTLIFSSGIGTPSQCLTSWSPKPLGGHDLTQENPGAKADTKTKSHSGPNLIDELDETNGTDLQSEMHEDTEELNALLYSDDDTEDSGDDEVTSTGHSPSTMTAHEKLDWFDGSTEEVASSAGPSKKRKLFDGDYDDVPSSVVSASSVKFKTHLDNEDDAGSSCGNCQNQWSCELGYLSSDKRMRKEKILETVNVLRSIIPDAKGKDAVLILDEAIDYLKSLKLKAKYLGLDSV